MIDQPDHAINSCCLSADYRTCRHNFIVTKLLSSI